jgi:hypothetical protein
LATCVSHTHGCLLKISPSLLGTYSCFSSPIFSPFNHHSKIDKTSHVSMYKQKHPTAIRAQSIPPKPKRPLTVFNLFGKLERSFILQSAQSLIPLSLERSIREDATSKKKVDPYLELRPERYRYIVSTIRLNSNFPRIVIGFTNSRIYIGAPS